MAKAKGPDLSKNVLFYGDNLDVMRRYLPDEHVDLVYLDPPFNSNRNYNVLFKQKSGDEAQAQIHAFDDTWTWGQDDEQAFAELQATAAPTVADAIGAMHQLIGPSDMLSYLVMMTQRLVELRRLMKPTASLYLHCDPVASHYLKVILDAIFGPLNFRGEITWLRTTTHNDAKRWSPNADIILYYGKTDNVTWNPVHLPHSEEYIASKYRHDDGDGRRYRLDNMTSPNPRPNLTYEWNGHSPPANGWRYSRERMKELDDAGLVWYPDSKSKRPQLKRYLDEQLGPVAGNVWTDISPINSRAKERLGYPTQKPVALLERIVKASSNEGDVIFDPFCGCGTTVDAAQRLDRRWIGIDISYLSVDLMDTRLVDTYGSDVRNTFQVIGLPADVGGARALFNHSPFEFERWAVSLVEGTPNEKQVGDRGVDGVIRFPLADNATGRVLVSVKGGKQLNPGMVRDLGGTVEAQKDAVMGIFLSIEEPTKGMIEAANHSGSFVHEITGVTYPKLQLMTVGQLLTGSRPHMPTPYMPYLQAQKFVPAPSRLPGL